MNHKIDLNEKDGINKKPIFNILIWMTTKEAAEYLRISESALRTLIHRYPRIPRYKLGKSLRFKREELDKLIESSFLNSKEKL
jgi:excisionase family DNA binding protein